MTAGRIARRLGAKLILVLQVFSGESASLEPETQPQLEAVQRDKVDPPESTTLRLILKEVGSGS
jgi:hypothetical protein